MWLFLSQKDDKILVGKATINLRRKYGRVKQISIVERDAFIPANAEKDIRENFLKKKAITATDIAVRYDIRVSTATLLLRQ